MPGVLQAAEEDAEPEWVYMEPEFPPLPPAEWAPALIAHIREQRSQQEKAVVLNYAGEHSSGWEIYHVDEERLTTW